jgi:hypothetical protein
VGTWARVLGYAAGVLGAACLAVLLGGSPASADEGGAPADRGLLGTTTAGLSDTVRRTVDQAARPVRDAAPEPVGRVVDAAADGASSTVDRVGAGVGEAVDRPVARVTEEVRGTVATATEAVEAPPVPQPTGPAAGPTRTQQLQERLPARADRTARSQRPTPSPAPTAAPGAEASMVLDARVTPSPLEAADDPQPLHRWGGATGSDDAAATATGGGAVAAADAADRVVLPTPEGGSAVAPAHERVVPHPASPPGFSPD